MAKKYLDKAGVQVLWNKVKEQIANSSGGSGSSNVKIIQVSGSFVEESETEAYINLSESTFTQIESHDKAKALVLYFTTYATYAYCIYFKNAQSNNCFLVYKEANYNANLSGFMTGYITSVDKKFHFNKIGMANATGTISEDKGTPSVIIDVDSGRDGYNYFTFNFKNLSNTKIYEISGDIVDGKIVISNEIWTDLLGYTRKYPTVIYFPDAECYAYPLRVNGGDFLNAYITYNTETKVISRGVFGDGYFVFYPLGEVDLSNYYNKTEIEEKLGEKQQKLVSGTNIKTINNQNILGSGNINIESGSSFEIPTITLTPTNDDPISGTLSDEDYTTIQNNNIIKFVVPNKVDAIVSKQVVQDMSFFFFLIGHTIYNLLIESNKSFSISQTQLPLGTRITGNNLGIYDDAGNLMGGTVSKTQMQEWLEIGGGGNGSSNSEIIELTLSGESGTIGSNTLNKIKDCIANKKPILFLTTIGTQSAYQTSYMVTNVAIIISLLIVIEGVFSTFNLYIDLDTGEYSMAQIYLNSLFAQKSHTHTISDIMDLNKGAANGVASLDAKGKIPTSQLPEMSSNSPKLYEFNIKVKCNISTSTRYTSAILVIRGFESDYSKVQSITSDTTALLSYLIEKYRNSSIVVNGYLYSGTYPANVTTADPILEANIGINYISLRSFNGTQVQTTTLADVASIIDAQFTKILG